MYSVMGGRKQRNKISCSVRAWRDAFISVLQGSFLGSLIFILNVDDLFFTLSDTAVCKLMNDTAL